MKLSEEAYIKELEQEINIKENELVALKHELKRARTFYKKKSKKKARNTALDVAGSRFEKNATVKVLTESRGVGPKVKGLLGNVTKLGQEEEKERWCSIKLVTGRVITRKAKNLLVVLPEEDSDDGED